MAKHILAQHMGEGFARLSPLLKYVHSGTARLYGSIYVRRGNLVSKIICTLFRFPKENEHTKLTVDCTHSPNEMIWKRNFDGLVMNSNFILKDEYLIECLGGLKLFFKAREENKALRYYFSKTRFLGIPLPKFLSPRVSAFEQEVNGNYCFSVYVSLFLVGKVIEYGGTLNIDDESKDEYVKL